MASPVLSQEVFDEIISQLDDETSTLKSRSLVCRSFRRNAQKMLFNHTVVSLIYDGTDAYNYYASQVIGPDWEPVNLVLIVKHAPHLIEYIQELRISCLDKGPPSSETADLEHALGVFSRKGEFPINLQSLSLRFDDLWWYDIDPWVQDALTMLLNSACSLRHIFLDEIMGCPANLFQNLPSLLKHLSLTNMAFSSLPKTRKELPALESLTVAFYERRHRRDELSDALERIMNTTQLKAFEGRDCTPYSMPVFEQILRPTSNSLEHLTLQEFNTTDPDSISIDLNQFSQLTDITIYQPYFHTVNWVPTTPDFGTDIFYPRRLHNLVQAGVTPQPEPDTHNDPSLVSISVGTVRGDGIRRS